MNIDTTHWPTHPTKSGWILKNENGDDVRIVCVDRDGNSPIMDECGRKYRADGICGAGGLDLVIPADTCAELREAQKAGKTIQVRATCQDGTYKWYDLEPSDPITQPAGFYRIKPVPLTHEDVPIGSAIRNIGGNDGWGLVTRCTASGICFHGAWYSFERMMEYLEINRNDGKGWCPCSK